MKRKDVTPELLKTELENIDVLTVSTDTMVEGEWDGNNFYFEDIF